MVTTNNSKGGDPGDFFVNPDTHINCGQKLSCCCLTIYLVVGGNKCIILERKWEALIFLTIKNKNQRLLFITLYIINYKFNSLFWFSFDSEFWCQCNRFSTQKRVLNVTKTWEIYFSLIRNVFRHHNFSKIGKGTILL